jgi:hypothetical protein
MENGHETLVGKCLGQIVLPGTSIEAEIILKTIGNKL